MEYFSDPELMMDLVPRCFDTLEPSKSPAQGIGVRFLQPLWTADI